MIIASISTRSWIWPTETTRSPSAGITRRFADVDVAAVRLVTDHRPPTTARCQLTGEQLEQAAATHDEWQPESPRDDLTIDFEQDADDIDRLDNANDQPV